MVPAPPPHHRAKRPQVVHARVAVCVGLLAGSLQMGVAPGAERSLWGYGVRGCDAYLTAVTHADAGDAAELQRYEDWLTGFVSALNLALGEEVLRGSGLEEAMLGTREYCRRHGDKDFFNAAMAQLRGLSAQRR